MEFIHDPATLEAVYGPEEPEADAAPGEGRRTSAITEPHRDFIAQATAVILASIDNSGVTCSPRGGEAGTLAVVHDDHTLWVPDASGGRLHQTVRNLMGDPRLGLLFMAPPQHRALRVQGVARVSVDAAALAPFTRLDPPVRSVLVVDVQAVRLSGQGPLRRAGLWAGGNRPFTGQRTVCKFVQAH